MKSYYVICFLLLITTAMAFSQTSKIERVRIPAPSLNRTLDGEIYLPPNYSATSEKPYRVYIFLHGAAGSISWAYSGEMSPILDSLINRGRIEPMIVVYPVLTFVPVQGKAIPYDIHFYTDSERNGKYATAISNDLLEWLPTAYHVTARREERGIGGFSMGADGALRIAIRNSDKFIACVAHDGTPPIRGWLAIYEANLFSETPGPPYNYSLTNGFYSAVWFGGASAFSPNLTNPNMSGWSLDFPFDSQGAIIDSVFYGKWMKNHDAATMLLNPGIYKNDIAIYFDATVATRKENDIFHNELSYLGIPHTYKLIAQDFHGIYPEALESGLRFLDAAMDSAMAKVIRNHDLQLKFTYDNILTINTFSNGSFKPKIEIKNIGTESDSNFNVICKIEQNGTTKFSDKILVNKLNSLESRQLQFQDWHPEVPGSYELTIISELSTDETRLNDTLRATLTSSNLVDDFESGLNKWTSNGHWGITNENPHKSNFCMKDSPFLYYENNTDTWIMYYSSFDFSRLHEAHLSFWTRYYMEKNHDFGYVEVSADSEKTWQQLGDSFTGMKFLNWIEVNYSLTKYCGEGFDDVRIRFHLVTDSTKNFNGWFLDDIAIYPTETSVSNPHSNQFPQQFVLYDNYPNPFNSETRLSYQIPKSGHVKLIIYNSIGQTVKVLVNKEQEAGYHKIIWNGNNNNGQSLSSGLYFYSLEFDGMTINKKLLLLK